MKKILILYPHFPPSNLAGVHRPRLFAQHLPVFGWEPIILTVHEKYYEESLDHNLTKLLPINLRIEKVSAFKVTKPRLIGDIGIRGFFQLYKKAKSLILLEKIDFLFIPIPSFYCALLGRFLNCTTNIKYGIDYIDPWVHQFPGSDKLFSRHWLSTKIAKFLEPIAVKNASLITGISPGYYKGVQDRNPHLIEQAIFGAMPYGAEEKDYLLSKILKISNCLFNKKPSKIQLVYAGAMLPKAYELLKGFFESIAKNREFFKELELHFIGTGVIKNNHIVNTIQPLAESYDIWQTFVFEYPDRIPYLEVLAHLNMADGIFVLGSTEPHYSPSKIYQGILSRKPIFAILNKQSTANDIISNSNSGIVLSFEDLNDFNILKKSIPENWTKYKDFLKSFNPDNVNFESFNNNSAVNVTKELSILLNNIIK